MLQTLEQIRDATRYKHLIEFLSETSDQISGGDQADIDLVAVVDCLGPVLARDRHGCRHPCLRMLKAIIVAGSKAEPDTAVLDSVLASGQAMLVSDPDPRSQLLVVELVGILFQRRSWPWSYTSRAWTYLQACDQSTNWDNVRRMAQWSGLAIAQSHFSDAGLDQVRAWQCPARIWHEALDRALQCRSCWKTRLWALKLVWIVSFRSAQVLRSAPISLLDRIRYLHELDPDPDLRLAAGAMIDLVDQVPGASLSTCQTRLDPGSAPGSLTEITIKVPDLRHRPVRSGTSSPAPGLDDTGSDISEGAVDVNEEDHDDYINGGELDGRRNVKGDQIELDGGGGGGTGVDRDSTSSKIMNVSAGEGDDHLPGSTSSSYDDDDGEEPIRLLDLSLIELQWTQ